MARRVTLAADAAVDGLAALHVPTLVVTGEAGLDRVVPTALTAEYTRIWPHATSVTLARTGHLGLVTRPERVCRRRRGVCRDLRVGETEAGLKTAATWQGDGLAELDSRDSGRGGTARVPDRSAEGDAARRGRVRAPAADRGRHDAHEGRVSERQGAGRHRLRRAALQLPRRRPQRRRLGRGARRDGRLPRRGRLHGRARIRASSCGPPGFRSAPTSR